MLKHEHNATEKDGRDRTLERQIEECLDDLVQQLDDEDGPNLLAIALLNVSIKYFARANPPNLSKSDVAKIKSNYPDATSELITERAMSDEGVVYAVSGAVQMARIALDYSPGSNVTDIMERDEVMQPVIAKTFGPELERAYTSIVQNGLSPFGASTIMILLGAQMAANSGVPWQKAARPLLDAFSRLHPNPASQEEMEEEVIQFLMQQMMIGRATAKRYVERAKQMRGNE